MDIIRIPLNDATAKLVQDGTEIIVKPFKKKPPEYDTYSDAEYEFIITGLNKPPCKVGDMLYFLETWAYWENCGYLYKTTHVLPPHLKWRSPVTMPTEACRHKYPCTSIEMMQVKDINGWKIEDTKTVDMTWDTFYDLFFSWFTSTHNLPLDTWVWAIGFERS